MHVLDPMPSRVLVFSMAGIGDTLMATPVLRELRAHLPGARIEVVVMWHGSAQLLEGNPHIDHVHAFNLIERPGLQGIRFLTSLRHPRPDLSLTLHPQGRRAYRAVARWVGARRRFSHRYENHCLLDRGLVTDSIPQDYSVSCAENNLRLVDLLGVPRITTQPRYELFLAEADHAWAESWCRSQGLHQTPWLGVHVGSGGTKNLALRRWPVQRWVEFARLWQARRPGLPIVAFGGPGEQDAHDAIQRALPPGLVRVAQAPSIRAAAALVSRARAFVSVDTAFMHIAAATSVPTQVVIETPTLNPPVHPLRPDWIRIPNPAVAGRPLSFYRYDGRPIAGTNEEIERVMLSVAAAPVVDAMAPAF